MGAIETLIVLGLLVTGHIQLAITVISIWLICVLLASIMREE